MRDHKVGTIRRPKMTVMLNRALKTWSLSANWLFGLIFPDQSSLIKVDGGWRMSAEKHMAGLPCKI